jgi:hypothetical protein
VGTRCSSAMVCVCGAGVRVVPIFCGAAGVGGVGGGGGVSASSAMAASMTATPASVSLGAAVGLPLPSAIFEVSPVSLPVASVAAGMLGTSAQAAAAGGAAGYWACILVATSLRGTGDE